MKQKHILQTAIKFCCAFAIILGITSCTNDAIYQQSKDLPNGLWEKDSAVVLPCYMSDTTNRYNVLIDLRSTKDYPYQNFWLFVNLYNPKGDVFRDTLECMIYDFDGRPLGMGAGGSHYLPVQFLSGVQFQTAGKYKFELIQGMRNDSLIGISDIGVRIVPAKQGDASDKTELEMQSTAASVSNANSDSTNTTATSTDSSAAASKKDTTKQAEKKDR